MLSYFLKFEDEYGFIHSIDKLSVCWFYNSPGRYTHPFLDSVKDQILELCDLYKLHPDTKLNLKPMSAFSWTYHYIHCQFGLPVFIGYQNVGKGEIELKNYVRIEFNPNKVYEENNLIDDIIRVLNAFKPSMVKVNRLDYAIDMPVPFDDVVVLQTRKNKRWVKGTIYLGKRMAHNSVKIYDKQKESKLENPLTRFEITCKKDHEIKFDNIMVMMGDKNTMEGVKINCTTETLVKMCLALKNAGYDYMDFLDGLNSRRKKDVKYLVEGIGQTLLYDPALFEELFKEVVEKLNLGIEFEQCGPHGGRLMETGFEWMDIDDDDDLPFSD